MPSAARSSVLACAAILLAGAVAGSCGPEGTSGPVGSVGSPDGGGVPDAGGPADGGTGGAPDAGSGSPDAGSGGGGGGGGGGGPPAECAALMPAAPGDPRVYSHDYDPDQGFCGDAQGDGTGVLALQVQDSGHPAWRFVAPNASELGSATFWQGDLREQPSRYTGFIYNAESWFLVQAVDEHGARGGGSNVYTPDVGSAIRWPDPNGGLFIAGKVSATKDAAPSPQVWMFESNGNTRWGPNPLGSDAAIFGASVDLLGRALVITDGGGGTIAGIWFDRDGTRMTPFFPIATNFQAGPATWFEAAPLIGGGLAVRRVDAPAPGAATGWHSRWIATIPSGSSTAQAAPDWLTSRPDTWIKAVRGNTAYAALPMRAQGTACDQKAEVLTPGGASCGALDFPISSSSCDTFDLRVGLDGTVLQRLPTSLERSSNPRTRSCTLRFWPAFLK